MTPNIASKYLKAKSNLKKHPDLKEKWVQERIAEDPSLLGLGTLKLVKKELQQPGGGRVDLVLANCDGEELGDKRYEVEVQLGGTDPSHIIRTLEYWDVERSRNPDHEHYAILIAEDITGRFSNVLPLLNKSVPLIAIQMQAMELGEHITLVFTTVVNLSERQGTDTEAQPPKDRDYWQEKSKDCLEKADEFLSFIHGDDAGFELRYNQDYLGVSKAGRNLLAFIPLKGGLRLRVQAQQSDALDDEVVSSGFTVQFNKRAYVFELDPVKYVEQAGALKKFIKLVMEADNW